MGWCFSTMSVCSLAVITPIMASLVSRKSLKSPKKRWWPKQCYKWIIDTGKKNGTGPGEMIICPHTDSKKLFFYLWWLKEADDKTGLGQYFYLLEHIKLEGEKISFSFKNDAGGTKSKDKQLTIDQWEKPTINEINGQSLESNCKMEGNYLKCLSCAYKSKKLSSLPFYF